MQKNIFKKGLVFAVIIFFICTGVVSALNVNLTNESKSVNNGNWLYVGGNGPGNYTKIQDAIDNAYPGDTVYVYSGIYYEKVMIQISITLLGEEQNQTIIDIDSSGGIVILVLNAPNVTIDGFSFRNHPTMYHNAGIRAYSSSGLMVRNITDIYYGGSDFGISLFYSDHSTITRMFFNYKNNAAIDIQHSHNVTISENHIIGSQMYMVDCYGISLTDSSEITIIKNNITYNTLSGVYLQNSHNVRIVGNIIQRNKASGVSLLLSNSNIIQNNELSLNVNNGIFIEESKKNTIFENNIYNNGWEPVFFQNAFHNKWNANFWGEGSSKRYYIQGTVHFERLNISFPIWKVDWYPAQEPYDIP